jgi:hypothetical protein
MKQLQRMFEQHRALATSVYIISIIVTLIVAFKVSFKHGILEQMHWPSTESATTQSKHFICLLVAAGWQCRPVLYPDHRSTSCTCLVSVARPQHGCYAPQLLVISKPQTEMLVCSMQVLLDMDPRGANCSQGTHLQRVKAVLIQAY